MKIQNFKSSDASSYDSVIDEFDRFTDRFSAPLAARMLALAGLEPVEQVLDVGTGTGVVALRAAEKLEPTGKVVGIDLSNGMLAAARAKAARAGLSDRIDFRKMDAEALDLDEASFDKVLSLFALLHFPNPRVALGEMFRVLRPGGKLIVAVGSGPPWISLRGFAHRAGRVCELLQGERLFAPALLNALVERHIPANGEAEETDLAREARDRTRSVPLLVRRAGFINIRNYWEGHQAVVETPEEFWNVQRTFSSIARKRLSKADPAQLDSLKQEFFRKCREVQSRGGSLVYPSAALFVVARRPSLERRSM